jgi:hypothetical protein
MYAQVPSLYFQELSLLVLEFGAACVMRSALACTVACLVLPSALALLVHPAQSLSRPTILQRRVHCRRSGACAVHRNSRAARRMRASMSSQVPLEDLQLDLTGVAPQVWSSAVSTASDLKAALKQVQASQTLSTDLLISCVIIKFVWLSNRRSAMAHFCILH